MNSKLPDLATAGEQLLSRLANEFPAFSLDSLCLQWQWVDEPTNRFCHQAEQACYPASVIKLFYMAATLAWQENGKLLHSQELERALDEMIRLSSNDATGYLLDCLTDTTSGPELDLENFERWAEKRRVVNRYFAAEFAGLNACQKTWGDGPFGRERQFYGAEYTNRNSMTAAHGALFMQLLADNRLVSQSACQRMRALLKRNLAAQTDESVENQVQGFLAQDLSPSCTVYSKAGWTSQVRHDVALICDESKPAFVLSVFTNAPEWADNRQLLPFIGREALALIQG